MEEQAAPIDGHVLRKERLDVLIVHDVEGVAIRFQDVAFDTDQFLEEAQRNDRKGSNNSQRTVDLFDVRQSQLQFFDDIFCEQKETWISTTVYQQRCDGRGYSRPPWLRICMCKDPLMCVQPRYR